MVNAEGKIEMDAAMLQVLLASAAGFTALFFWLHRPARRLRRRSRTAGESAARERR